MEPSKGPCYRESCSEKAPLSPAVVWALSQQLVPGPAGPHSPVVSPRPSAPRPTPLQPPGVLPSLRVPLAHLQNWA